jgi:hypothetical protein
MLANRPVAVLRVLPLAVVGLFLIHSAEADEPIAAQPQGNDDSLNRSAGDDLDELEAGLIHVDASIGFTGGGSTISPLDSIRVNARVAKITTHLLQMPPADASARVQRLFDRSLQAHQAGYELCIARRKGEDSSTGMIPISGNASALSVSLFLCALHCDREIFLKKLDAWQTTLGPLMAECMSNPKLKLLRMQASMDGLPNRLLMLDLYILVLERDAQLDLAALERRCGCRLPAFHSESLAYWDAERNRVEFTHSYRSPFVGRTIPTNVEVSMASGGFNEAEADAILATLRTMVDNIGKPPF